MDVEPKIRGKHPKMDGENNGKPYEQMDDLGVPFIFGNTHINNIFLFNQCNSNFYMLDLFLE